MGEHSERGGSIALRKQAKKASLREISSERGVRGKTKSSKKHMEERGFRNVRVLFLGLQGKKEKRDKNSECEKKHEDLGTPCEMTEGGRLHNCITK